MTALNKVEKTIVIVKKHDGKTGGVAEIMKTLTSKSRGGLGMGNAMARRYIQIAREQIKNGRTVKVRDRSKKKESAAA